MPLCSSTLYRRELIMEIKSRGNRCVDATSCCLYDVLDFVAPLKQLHGFWLATPFPVLIPIIYLLRHTIMDLFCKWSLLMAVICTC